MAGTTEGGRKCAATNRKKYGENYYAVIGKKGGELGRTGGWASKTVGKDGMTGPERASVYGTVGGRISRRPNRKQAA